MILWSLAPTQLILGEDMTLASAQYIATVGNEELIAVNQDLPFVGPATRIVGGDLSYPCTPPPPPSAGLNYAVLAQPCGGAAEEGLQSWGFDDAAGRVTLLGGKGGVLTLGADGCTTGGADGSLVFVAKEGGGGAGCGGQVWRHQAGNNSIVGPFSKCLDEYQCACVCPCVCPCVCTCVCV